MMRNEMGTGSGSVPGPHGVSCGEVRDLLPARIAGGMERDLSAAVEGHLGRCVDCRSHAEFVSRLRSARRDPPDHLLPAILATLPELPFGEGDAFLDATGTDPRTASASPAGSQPSRSAIHRWAWALPAAAGVVLAIAIGSLSTGTRAPEAIWSLALEPEAPLHWYGDDWVVAGEPYLDALPDEVLRALLEEMNP